jgi:nitrogen fixation-related uncharacterized protein
VVWPSRFLIPLGLAVALLVLVLRLWSTLRGQSSDHGRAGSI